MDAQEIESHKAKIDRMTQEDMCRMWRFTPSGHPYFSHDSPLCDYFQAKFNELGGFTPEISKRIGLG